MDEIAVRRLMSTHVRCVSRGATLAEAASLMYEHCPSCLVVTHGDVPACSKGWTSVVKLADKALYAAKAAGKNTLAVHQDREVVAD